VPAARLAVTTVLLSLVIRFPNASSIRTTGCCGNGVPANGAAEGCDARVSLLAPAGPTANRAGRDVAQAAAGEQDCDVRRDVVREVGETWTKPAEDVTLVVPCNVPLPVPLLRVAVTLVPPSPLRKLPKLVLNPEDRLLREPPRPPSPSSKVGRA